MSIWNLKTRVNQLSKKLVATSDNNYKVSIVDNQKKNEQCYAINIMKRKFSKMKSVLDYLKM